MNAHATHPEELIQGAAHPAAVLVRIFTAVGGLLLAAFLVFVVGKPGRAWTPDRTGALVFSLVGAAVGISLLWAALRPTRRALLLANTALILIPLAGAAL